MPAEQSHYKTFDFVSVQCKSLAPTKHLVLFFFTGNSGEDKQFVPIMNSLSEYLQNHYPSECCIRGAYVFSHPKELSAFNADFIINQAEYAAQMMNTMHHPFGIVTHSIGSVVAKKAIQKLDPVVKRGLVNVYQLAGPVSSP